MESHRQLLEDSATAWLQRRELGPWSNDDSAGLTKWLEASTAHRVAFLRLEAAWEEMARLKAVASGFARRVPTPGELHLSTAQGGATGAVKQKTSFKPAWRWTLAASLLLIVGGFAVGYWQSVAPSYRTPKGGLTSIPLKDGSSVMLNTASEIKVRMTAGERRVELTKGEAFFEVVQDPARPFIVIAGDQTITVLGTAFAVLRDGARLRVAVTEGKVKVDTDPAAPGETVLTAGNIAYAGRAGTTVRQEPLTQIDTVLSWRTGYLVFEDAPLRGVISEFSRYNERRIAIEDPAVDAIRLTGKFRSTNTDALVRLLEKSFHVRARDDGDTIFLSAE